jgi:hypothetical protein
MSKKKAAKMIDRNSNLSAPGLNNEESKMVDNDGHVPKRVLKQQRPLFEMNMLKPGTKEDYL